MNPKNVAEAIQYAMTKEFIVVITMVVRESKPDVMKIDSKGIIKMTEGTDNVCVFYETGNICVIACDKIVTINCAIDSKSLPVNVPGDQS